MPFSSLSICEMPSLQKIAAESYLKSQYSKIDVLKAIPKREQNKKIRIGYYSADFHKHPVSYLLVKLFELHDKSKFEIFGFSFGPEKNDEMRQRIFNTFDKVVNIKFKSNNEVVKLSEM